MAGRKSQSNSSRPSKDAEGRMTTDFAKDAVKVTFPDGTVFVGNEVVKVGSQAIVDGTRFVKWKWQD